MDNLTNELKYKLATAFLLNLLVNNKISQIEFEKIDELNKKSFNIG